MLLLKSRPLAVYLSRWLIVALLGFFHGRIASAATNFFVPVADASLLEVAVSNSMGGFAGMNSGTTQEYKKTRALMRFDLTSLPASTLIESAALHLDVTHIPDEDPAEISFGLHRVLRPWGEGTNSPSSQAGKGLAAIEGDATWLHAFFPTNFWSSPGGAAGVDFSSVESSFTDISYDQSYVFPDKPELVDDVTEWVRHPQNNFGWMLLCNAEEVNFTARRFGTREDFDHQPRLELQFLVPPLLVATRTNSNQIAIRFTAWAGHTYDVEYRGSISAGAWQLLSQVTATTTNFLAVVIDSGSITQRFYRVNAY